MNLRALLARGEPDKAALIGASGSTLHYAALRQAVDAFARALGDRGIAPGERVALALGNAPSLVVAFFGVVSARATAAPLNPAYTRDEFAFYLEDIAPKLLLTAAGEAPAARAAARALDIPVAEIALDERGCAVLDGRPLEPGPPAAEPQPNDVALFLHTSGTTSRPKGVPLTHRNLATSTNNIVRWYRIGPADVSLCVMPLFHVHGLVFSTLATLGAGASEVIPERFSATAFWPLVREHGATIVSAVPTIYRTLLLRADGDAAPGPREHSLRFLRSSSAALPAVELERLERRFGVPVIEAYSMTEAAHQMCANPLDGRRLPGSVGVGAFVEVAVMSEAGTLLPAHTAGEVVVRGDNVTAGYHNNPAANAVAFTNGWFRTGDIGRLDDEGYLTLVGRLKEMINRGGEKISPLEIDEALLAHPGVAEAVAFGIPDDKYGEAVAAAVVVRDQTRAEDLLGYLRSRLAPFKVPSELRIVDAIPKTATGKVQRRQVAASFSPSREGEDESDPPRATLRS